ncbi:MAG TPA: DUF3098 domain-containing protein [Ignavibacteriales bacterium]|nr:DUF3098 domain-containing protein [Ignavibacteriales bacterium]HOL80490.1 DUF3098 domain-containing protein [Ignavibacteriales bacterium]HOM64941.1 DUF3098 domain-containing protein [Ignavibacteriales bacterium]HPD67962.1 DUF3098 domain-containing protein [Ignavibacteriales bacterium]HPP34217.1 DUF3098 domain-containing protein [Ignavibacteriales bacterium]
MAKVIKKKDEKISIQNLFPPYLQPINYIILLIGIIVLVIGFYLMAQGEWDDPISLTVAPLVVLFGFIVVIPLGIFYKPKQNKEDNVIS